MEVIQIAAIILAAIGALNWGLVGLFKFDLVAFVTGGMGYGAVKPFSRLVYILLTARRVVDLELCRM